MNFSSIIVIRDNLISSPVGCNLGSRELTFVDSICLIIGDSRYLSTLIVIDADGSLASQTVAPPSINGCSSITAMGEQEPETEDWLGKNIKNGIGDDFTINRPLASSITNTPNDWVKSPEDQGEASNGSEELRGLSILGHDSTTARNGKLVNNDQVGSTSHGVPSPLLSIAASEGGEETGQNHDDISDNCNENVGAVEASEEGKVEKEKRSGDGPVNVTSPEDLSVDVLEGSWDVLVCFLDHDVCEAVSITGSHCEVGESCEEGDEGGQNVEETFLDWDSPCHEGKSKSGQEHNNEDNP